MQTVALADYNIYIGSDIWETVLEYVNKGNYSKVLVIADDNTAKHCLPIVTKNLPDLEYQLIKIPAGEQYKTIETCQQIWQEMMAAKASRNSLTLNLGGGVIGDMGGFSASTFKRGMDFIQLPTTLLSQVDASIGGKLGIDFQGIKNSIGVFRNPKAVFVNPDFYKTLPYRELRSGFAEMLKHALIWDKTQWEDLKPIENLREVDWVTKIVPSLKVKQEVVTIDPFEKGLRKALNFGHTIGHAIESVHLEKEEPLLHGEAIAIGMICESYLSNQLTGLSAVDLESIKLCVKRVYGTPKLAESDYDTFIELMLQDKKNIGDAINFSLLESTGKVIVNQTTDTARIIDSLNFYNS